MKTRASKIDKWLILATVALIALANWAACAGIPEPDLVLYGRVTTSATLKAAIDNTALTIPLGDGQGDSLPATWFPATVTIGSEDISVSAVWGDELVVTSNGRGANATTAASHPAGATVSITVTSGTLTMTYTPLSGGTPVSVSKALARIATTLGDLSYSLNIPCETPWKGISATAGTLQLAKSPVAYTRSASLDGQIVAMDAETAILVSEQDRGNIERVNLRMTGSANVVWGDLASVPGSPLVVDCNGTVGGSEAVLILQWYAGLITELKGCPDNTIYTYPDFPPGADVNGDGVLGGQDAVEILKYYAGIISCFPADPSCSQAKSLSRSMAKSMPVPRVLSLATDAPLPPAGTTLVMPVNIDNGTDVTSYRININYPAYALAFIGTENGPIAQSWPKPVVNDSDEGGVTVVNAATAPLQGSGDALLLTFRVKEIEDVIYPWFGSLTELNDGRMPILTRDGRLLADADNNGVPDVFQQIPVPYDPDAPAAVSPNNVQDKSTLPINLSSLLLPLLAAVGSVLIYQRRCGIIPHQQRRKSGIRG